MKKIAYKRCSTNEDKQDVGRQLHGMDFDEVVVEYASGKNEKGRPLFKKCLKELQSSWIRNQHSSLVLYNQKSCLEI